MTTNNVVETTPVDKLSNFIEDNEKLIRRSSLAIIAILAILVEILIGGLFSEPAEFLAQEDIYYVWLEGKRISDGVNPYEFVLDGDFLNNEKYAAYLPFFYLISALFHTVGITSFTYWIIIMRFVMTIFYIGIAYQLFLTLYRRSLPFAVFATIYWLFNRWTLIVVYVVHIDFPPLFFLIYSLQNFDKNKNRSLFALGLSLSMKHMAIFLVPLYLILLYRDKSIKDFQEYIVNVGKIVIIPLLLSIPFIIWNLKAFVYSMIFSGTRVSDQVYDELHNALGDETLLAFSVANRLFMILIMLFVYFFFIQRRIGRFTTSFLILVTFIEFNVVLFDQYRVWRVALLPFIFEEFGIFEKKVGLKSEQEVLEMGN